MPMTPEQICSTTKSFKLNGLPLLELLSQSELNQVIGFSNNLYYNDSANVLLTDNEFDIVKEFTSNKFKPKNGSSSSSSSSSSGLVGPVGARLPSGRNKVKLPYEMWSMDKIKPDTNELTNWVSKYGGPYVVSCKCDGVSGLYTTTGESPKLYTRGDGIVGQDVSHLLAVMKLPTQKGLVVRGEFIMPKDVFKNKYAGEFANPRNLAAGIINSKTIDSKTSDVNFVAYECIVPQLAPSEQLVTLAVNGFKVVDYQNLSAVTNEELSNYLVEKRAAYEYEIDGIIVSNDGMYARTSGNPEHAFAFKMVLSDQKAEAKVVDVIWDPSKNGSLKPRVRIEPVHLSGVTISFATGINGRFITENGIGVGAIIELIRSGDVIPKITGVVSQADVIKMPSVPYVWDDNHVDVVLENPGDNVIVREKMIIAFFAELEVDGLKSGNVRKLMDAGYDTISKILLMKKADFEKVGYKTMAGKYEANIQDKVGNATLGQIMVASGMMGRGIGSRKIEPVLTIFPDIVVSTECDSSKIAKLKMVDGIEQKTAQLFVDNIPNLIQFLKETGLEYKLYAGPPPAVAVASAVATAVVADDKHPLFGKEIVMTKIRDKEIIEWLGKVGAKLVDNIKSTTFVLIVKSKMDVSNKTKYAELHNIPIMTPDQFKSTFSTFSTFEKG